LLGNLSNQVEILERIQKVKGVESAYLQVLVRQEIVSKGLENMELRILKGLPPMRALDRHLLEIWGASWKNRSKDIRIRAKQG
jgi:hypothetical protein